MKGYSKTGEGTGKIMWNIPQMIDHFDGDEEPPHAFRSERSQNNDVVATGPNNYEPENAIRSKCNFSR